MLPPLSLRTKLLGSFLIAMLPVVVLLLVFYRLEEQHRKADILTAQMRTAQAVAALVDTTFDEAVGVATALAADSRLATQGPTELDPFLRGVLLAYPQYENLAVVDATGASVGDARLEPGAPRPNAADRLYFQQAMATSRPVVSEVIIGRVLLRPVVVAVAPVRDAGGRPTRVVLVALDLDYLARRLRGVELGPGQSIGVADRTGRTALVTMREDIPWEERDLSSLPPVQAALRGEAQRVDRYWSPIPGDERLGAFTPTPKYGWVVWNGTPASIALAPVQEALRLAVLAMAGVLLLSAAMALGLAQIWLGPLRRLTQHAAALGRGEYGHRVDIATGDELQRLGEAFNDMADRVERTLRIMQAVLDSVPSGVIMIDVQHQTRFVGRASETFGTDLQGLVGQDITALVDTIASRLQDPAAFREKQAWLDAHPGESVNDEWHTVGGKVLSRYVGPVYADRLLLGRIEVYHDVTEERRIEHLQREFLFLVSHEFRTPLTVVMGNLALVEHQLRSMHDGAAVEELGARLQKSRAAAWRLSNMVEELLDVSTIAVGRLEVFPAPVSLPQFLDETLKRLKPRLGSHGVRLEKPTQFPPVKADPARIAQVLTNLVINAAKYSPPETEIVVRLEAQEKEVLVSVRNQGSGVPAEDVPHLFDRFFRISASDLGLKEGLGLGLYINRAVVEAHGGQMCVESEPGQCTTFYFTLPLG